MQKTCCSVPSCWARPERRLSSWVQGRRPADGARVELIEERKGECVCVTSVGHTHVVYRGKNHHTHVHSKERAAGGEAERRVNMFGRHD